MPTYEDPGCCCKCFCPCCAVYQAQGCKCPEMLLALLFECLYTMTCWDPKAGSGYDDMYGAGTPSKSGAPQENKDMNR